MKKTILMAALMGFALTACNSDEKKAGILYQRAQNAFTACDYSLAKLHIDSIRMLYPNAFNTRKASIKMMQQIDLEEQRNTLVYLDSMMQVKQVALDSIKGNFVLEKDTAYQEIGNYFYPTQVVEKNIGRSFLRAQVNERGEMSLTSIYCAGGNIHHTAVKVSAGDLSAKTMVSTDSYETTDLGCAIEKADYKIGEDGDVAAFIVANQDNRITLEFIGDRTCKTQMQPNDIKAIVQISDLAHILTGMEEIRKEQKEANLKIRFVTSKMQEGDTGKE